jgi:fructosamine-3-kinase
VIGALAERIAGDIGCRLLDAHELSPGRTRRALRMETGDGALFVKVLPAGGRDMLAAEAEGLTLLRATGTFRVPSERARGHDDSHAWLALEWLELHPVTSNDEGRRFGDTLAALHAHHGPCYGLARDNWLGDSPQENGCAESWPLFYAHKRLRPQLERAHLSGYRGALIADVHAIIERVAALFLDYRPAASLLHGDLWHGNAGIDDAGRPAIFDPAVHYGDREADFAMAELFGGFPVSMYAAYQRSAPLHHNAPARRGLYRLHHLLNHYNLFGASYLREAERTAARLLAELR